MSVFIRPLVAVLLFAVGAYPSHAQVGHEPQRSPYKDLEFRQEITYFGGRLQTAKDPAGVAPRSGTMVGAHYEIRLAGPAYFTARMAGALTERTVIDPKLEKVNRVRDPARSVPLLLTDVGFSLNLTGFKSWHGAVPFLGGGLGIGAGFEKQDVGGYQFGYPFLFTVRPGVKFATGGKWHVRAEASNYYWRVRYPETYFVKTGADAPVLVPGSPRNYWKRNLGLNLGMTYTWGH